MTTDSPPPSDHPFDRPRITARRRHHLPVPHLAVEGRFAGTDTAFTCYFPDLPTAGRRQLHYLAAGFGGVNGLVASGPRPAGHDGAGALAVASIEFAQSCGAHLVESNQGHDLVPGRPPRAVAEDVLGYRANEVVSRWARHLAREHYGAPVERAYVFGGSGGGRRSLLALERSPGTWDGAVPFAIGADTFAMAPLVADALRRTRAVGVTPPLLARALRAAGWPADNAHARELAGFDLTLSLGSMDPTYRDAFWQRAGFAGADGAVDDQLVHLERTVRRRHTCADVLGSRDLRDRVLGTDPEREEAALASLPPEAVVAVELDEAVDLTAHARVGLSLVAGTEVVHGIRIDGDLVVGGIPTPVVPRPNDLGRTEIGSAVVLHNREYLAFCHAWRHDVAPDHGSAAAIWAVLGDPPPVLSARRPATLAPRGAFTGRMIHVAGLLDGLIAPRAVRDYADLVAANAAAEGGDPNDRYRLWFVENAIHRPTSQIPPDRDPPPATCFVDQAPVVQRALEHLMAWVEDGTPPPASTAVRAADDGFDPEPRADDRGGIQPVISLTVTRSGATVAATAVVEAPPDGDPVVEVEWDVGGTGRWVPVEGIGPGERRLVTHVERVVDAGDDVQVAVRATASPPGRPGHPVPRVQNVAWANDPGVSR